jgi:hypothetical protein
VAGLYATQYLAEIRGDTALADWYAGGPASILTALQRPLSWYPPGVWNLLGYYNRGVQWDNSVQPLEDSSSNMLIALGVIDHLSGRTGTHITTMKSSLSQNTYGMARYQGDDYYYSSKWDPACLYRPSFGNWSDPACDEVGSAEPSWPQMSMWVAVYEVLSGQQATALARLQWFASTSGRGHMPHGEAVSNATHQSVLTSMSEPLTASSFLITALIYQGQYDLRIVPPIYNAGTYSTITVSAATAGDWPQWQNIPYFVAAQSGAPKSPMTSVKRVYLSNDGSNLYVRLDNVAGAFSAFAVAPRFALRLYCQDFALNKVDRLSTGLEGQPIQRPMSFLVERRSDENVYRHWSVAAGTWVEGTPITGVIPPQWEAATGRLEAVVPIQAVASAPPPLGSAWGTIALALAYQDAASGTWIDDGRMLIHYRLSTVDQPWTYGNIEQAT